jgi:tRNA-2-methylthio-N6-dimethylallyladenosine synthase
MAEEHQRAVFARMPHVDLVVGPSAFGDIDRQVERARQRRAGAAGVLAVGDGVSGDTIRREVRVRPHRSQAYVSVMRGCNMPCTYCIVPATRGAEVSRTIAEIQGEAQRLADDGVTEITLLGQTVNAYGRDQGRDVTLARLLFALHEIPALRRIAFITSHPNFVTPELVGALVELPRVARYLHLPAQSGSNRVLRAMRRGYTRERYLEGVDLLRARAPDLELHSDFIVGYPGETEEDFAATVELMERVRFAQSYVFKYSPRVGTVAAELADDVAEDEKARRNAVLLEVQHRHGLARNRELLGTVQEVLVEGPSPKVAGRLTGRTATTASFTSPARARSWSVATRTYGSPRRCRMRWSASSRRWRAPPRRSSVDLAACMEEAVSLAMRGRGEVEPNPRVGALALRDGEVVGRGWHRGSARRTPRSKRWPTRVRVAHAPTRWW